ncbi:MAG: class I SAM-dependent methyltransferase [Aquabacterium sp.]|nr:class I SAM-dependent methyltransferase [Ferruginibacter sp.]
MRAENVSRLSSIKLRAKDSDYIHLYFLLQDLKKAILEYGKGDLLDLGCGNKPYEEWYKPVTKSQVGCDIMQSSENKVDVICLATALDFPDHSFDTILCTQVLEHVFDHHTLLKEAHRVLRPGGVIILTVPFCWELHEVPYDFFRITRHGLEELFKEQNFTVDTLKANGGKWAAMFQMFISTVFSTFSHRTVRSKVLKIIFIEFRLTWVINKMAIWIDDRYFDEWWTLNYIVIAKKN